MKQRAPALSATVALDVLLVAAPRPATAGALLLAPPPEQPTDAVVAAVALAAWLLATWLLATALLAVATRLPGPLGRASARALRRIAPAVLRRTVEVALGVGVTAGAVGATPALAAAPAPATAPAQAAASFDWPGTAPRNPLDWPISPAGARPAAPEPAAAPPAPSPSAAPAPPAMASAASPPAAPVRTPAAASPSAAAVPATQDPPAAPPPAAPPTADVARGGAGAVAPVIVRPGDSLWSLAAADLSRRTGSAPRAAQVAAAWPAWWAANRAVIGDDPDLIRPGTPLYPPGA